MSGIICVHPQASLPAIQVVQNTYSSLALSQTLERDGSEWTRSVLTNSVLQQDFSDFYGKSVSSTLVLASTVNPDALLGLSQSSAIVFSQSVTVAGGRVESEGGGGGESSSFAVTYDSGGPTTEEGLWVYIDSSDGEAKLAAYNSTAEVSDVAGFVDDTYDAGDPATVVTEGVITKSDWTNVAGTTNLTRGAYYYLHTGGQMRVTPPETGTVVILGRAMTSTKFDTEINPPLELEI